MLLGPLIRAIWPYLLAAVVVAFVTYKVNSWREDSKQLDLVRAQFASYQNQVDADIKLSREVSHEYQKNLSAARHRAADFNRVRGDTCIPTADLSRGADGSRDGTEPGRAHGVPARALMDFAVDSEEFRLRTLACKQFIERSLSR